MNKIILIISLIIISQMGFAQNNNNNKDTVMSYDNFPPGLAEIHFTKINSILSFPKEAISKSITTGKVYCLYKLDKDGNLYDIIIIKSTNKLFNKYAIKYLKGFQAKVKPYQIGAFFTQKVTFILE